MLVLRQWCSPRNGDTKDPKLLQLTLKSLVGMIHILHASSPGQRKVEIRTILDSYFKVLNSDQPMASLEGSPATRWEEGMIALRVNMLGRSLWEELGLEFGGWGGGQGSGVASFSRTRGVRFPDRAPCGWEPLG